MTTPTVTPVTPAQAHALNSLASEGFRVTNHYSDKVVRVARKLPNGDSLYTFVDPTGHYRPPICWEQRIEELTKEHTA